MTKKLVQHGNSAALILDKALLDVLHVTMDTPLEISTDGTNIIISPSASTDGEAEVLSALDRVNQAHAKTLAKLAK